VVGEDVGALVGETVVGREPSRRGSAWLGSKSVPKWERPLWVRQ
jgi:hypothetical protein